MTQGHTYTFDPARLVRGHSYGNSLVYCAMDPKTDLFEAPDHRAGLRDSVTQQYYLRAWTTTPLSASGEAFAATRTTFEALYQESELRVGEGRVTKRFFLPFENNHLRAAHYVLRSEHAPSPASVRCTIKLPAGATVAKAEHLGHAHLAITYPNGFTGVLWASGPLVSVSETLPDVTIDFAWPADLGATFGLTFAASPHGNAVNAAIEQFAPDAGKSASHLRRLRTVERESQSAVDHYLDTARLHTPDAIVNRGALWAKINQLRDYQEYAHGAGFSNAPPCDQYVARDTFWFLVSSNFYAQQWSRRMLDTWFRLGVEPNGKFIEYMLASGTPMFRDDYGLNINDNTPLMLIASAHYFALSGDRGFLDANYAMLLTSANYILAQRDAGGAKLNPHRLVWCTSTETFTRGLCSWRNCFAGGRISGAVTEINSECVMALRAVADLAAHIGDTLNASRLNDAAEDLRRAINTHLRSNTPNNPHYLLMIDPFGERDDALTADLLFPILCDVAEPEASQKILETIYGQKFWVTSPTGGAGMRTVAPDQPGAMVKAEPGNYGLTGGVWPNLALWAGRAAAQVGRPDLLVQGLRGTMMLSDREDFDRNYVTPGEFPEYFNGDDLVQRGNLRSTFIHGSYVWAATEGIMGLRPRAAQLEVNPQLPRGWKWAALTNLPYRGFPLSLLASAENRTLYTTARVQSDWTQIICPLALQSEYLVESSGPPVVWIIAPGREKAAGEAIVAGDQAAEVRIVHRAGGRVAAEMRVGAGEIVRAPLRA